MKMPEISIIVPVYNTEKWLRRCVDSILAQTFKDFELLLIDDGSTDNSGTICDEYVGKGPRVRVFHKSNGGVSSARNLGLNNVRGKYIAFCDSDDWVENNYLSVLSDNDKCCYTVVIERHALNEQRKIISKSIEESAVIILKYFCPYFQTPYNKLFLNSIIQEGNIRFDEAFRVGEDILFNIQYIQNIRFDSEVEEAGIVAITDNLYHYNTANPNSLTKKADLFPEGWVIRIYHEILKLSGKFGKGMMLIYYRLSSWTFNDIINIRLCDKKTTKQKSLTLYKWVNHPAYSPLFKRKFGEGSYIRQIIFNVCVMFRHPGLMYFVFYKINKLKY